MPMRAVTGLVSFLTLLLKKLKSHNEEGFSLAPNYFQPTVGQLRRFEACWNILWLAADDRSKLLASWHSPGREWWDKEVGKTLSAYHDDPNYPLSLDN